MRERPLAPRENLQGGLSKEKKVPFDIQNYGAIPNDPTADNFSKIQQAIVDALQHPSDNVVKIGSGTFWIKLDTANPALAIDSGRFIRIEGENDGSSVIGLNAPAPASMAVSGFLISDVGQVQLLRISFVATGDPGTAADEAPPPPAPKRLAAIRIAGQITRPMLVLLRKVSIAQGFARGIDCEIEKDSAYILLDVQDSNFVTTGDGRSLSIADEQIESSVEVRLALCHFEQQPSGTQLGAHVVAESHVAVDVRDCDFADGATAVALLHKRYNKISVRSDFGAPRFARILNCTAVGTYHGVLTSRSGLTEIRGCIIDGSSGSGLVCQNSAVIEDCRFIQCGISGYDDPEFGPQVILGDTIEPGALSVSVRRTRFEGTASGNYVVCGYPGALWDFEHCSWVAQTGPQPVVEQAISNTIRLIACTFEVADGTSVQCGILARGAVELRGCSFRGKFDNGVVQAKDAAGIHLV